MLFLDTLKNFKDAYEVFLLFMIPIGGGIPAGVVLGNLKGISWETMTFLYFCSDVVLACLFDPVMRFLIRQSKRSIFFARLKDVFKKSILLSTAQYGSKPGPLILILIAFGVDPMTGRAATYMAGHGFLSGWTLAIAGDLVFFLVVMASTLWLNNFLGDGTMTAVIITVLILVVPAVIKKIRQQFKFEKK